ncbi:biotin--[acetyl-CoA-carboxylase] ligase [soil metagenome]
MVEHRWARPQWYESIDSTNRAVLADPVLGVVVVADHQSQGQGRRGRTWTAPPGTALAVSVSVPSVPPARRGWVPLLAGLAVARALREHPDGISAGLKWPNDVMVTGPGEPEPRKVCGILAAARPDVLVIGAGLNIDQSRDQLPTPLATSWTLALGGPVRRDVRTSWLTAYLDQLAELLDGLARGAPEPADDYRRSCQTIGAQVRIDLPGGEAVLGVARRVDDQGALVVRTEDGEQTYHAGDVIHLRPQPDPDGGPPR